MTIVLSLLVSVCCFVVVLGAEGNLTNVDDVSFSSRLLMLGRVLMHGCGAKLTTKK